MEDLYKTVRNIAEYLIVAAKTAPKAKGQDNLLMKIIDKKDLNDFADKMIIIGKTTGRPQTFSRDAENIRSSEILVIIATRYKALGLDCGFCGFRTCKDAEESNSTCAYNSGDLGIAIGSAVSTASSFHIDNRIMYTAGYTAIKIDIFGENIRMALGIPLSISGKNIFFDRTK